MATMDNRSELIRRARGDAAATYGYPDGFIENGVFYSRQKPNYGEYLPLILFVKQRAEYMAGHEGEPLYVWEGAPQDAGSGLIISFGK